MAAALRLDARAEREHRARKVRVRARDDAPHAEADGLGDVHELRGGEEACCSTVGSLAVEATRSRPSAPRC